MIIDDRDGSRDLVFLHPLNEMAVLSRLDSGDISIVGNGPNGTTVSIGVEYKSIEEFVTSEASGRLSGTDGQLVRMFDEYDRVYVLTYGKYRSGPFNRLEFTKGERWKTYKIGTREVPYGFLEGAITSITECGVRHKHVETEQDAAHWLAALERWWSKPYNKHKFFRKFNDAGPANLMPSVDPDTLFKMKLARALPGVGWEKAFAIANCFPSGESMVNASVREWLEVPGIGKVMAETFHRLIRARSGIE